MEPLRLLIVGAGQRGQQWLRFCATWDGVEAVAVADPDPAARNLARTYLAGAQVWLFPKLEFALGRIEADAALVCTPLPDHTATALQCLESGLPVLLEKPFAETIAEAREMVRAAESRRLPLIIAQNYRHSTLECTLRSALREGVIGTPGFIQCTSYRHRPAAETYHRMLRFAQMDMAVHHFDNWRSLLASNAAWAEADAFNPSWSEYRHGAVLHAHFEMENGVHIAYSGAWASQSNVYHQRIDGSDGYLETDGEVVRHGVLTAARQKRVRDTPGDDPPKCRVAFRGMSRLLRDLTEAVRTSTEAETNARDNLHTLGMAVACMRSSDEGRRVYMDEVLEAE